ncbi:MAG: SBBP repeat-containing protein [bacterium]
MHHRAIVCLFYGFFVLTFLSFLVSFSSAGQLVYSTYLGSGGREYGGDIAVDSLGNVYITGYTISSTDFPTTSGAFDTTFNGGLYDIFISKLNASGTALVYSSYLGGTGDDEGRGIAIDSSGNAYICGYTNSTNFPTTFGAFDTTFNGGLYDGFVSKLNSNGTALVYSTYLGGDEEDRIYAIAVDSLENVYITGNTGSPNFPTTSGAYKTTFYGIRGTANVFMSKLNANGNSLIYSTYVGGGFGYDLAIDTLGNTYITGCTDSSVFYPTTPNAFDTTAHNYSDGFVTKLNDNGTALVYSTYLGGISDDYSNGIAVDGLGNAYLTGYTYSTDFPTTPDAFDTTYSVAGDIFVSKLNPNGTALIYSTYLGGGDLECSFGGIAIDGSGNAYITGCTYSSDFPTTPGAFDTTLDIYNDVFVSKVNFNGTELLYSTYLGGNNGEYGKSIAIDGLRNVYICGPTSSTNFPTTPGAFDTSNNGGVDVFVTKISTEYIPIELIDFQTTIEN